MTILRPVTTKSPSSVEVLEDSGLPFGFVLTPFAHRSAISKGNDDKFNQKRNPRSCGAFPTKASLIAKCTHCGSPLNPTCNILDHWRILCTICGKCYDGGYQPREKDENNTLPSEEAEYRKRYSSQGHREECHEPIVEYSLPLFSMPNPSSRRKEDIYTLGSSHCPPLLAIFIDGTSSDTEYYKKIASTLQTLIDGDDSDQFKGSRMGIFIMTANGGLSAFDFTNPGGHIKHLWINPCPLEVNHEYHNDQNQKWESQQGEYDVASLADVMTAEQIFAPLDGNGRSYIENALRELADSTISIQQACQRQDTSADSGVFLGSAIQYFLEFIEDTAYHPGEMQDMNENDDSPEAIKPHDKFMYAGGKIMCFLSKAPDEIGNKEVVGKDGRIGRGGSGGACAEVGRRFGASLSDANEQFHDHDEDPNDVEAAGIQLPRKNETNIPSENRRQNFELPPTKYLKVDEYYQDLGITCAISAFGVEIFALCRNDDSKVDKGEIYFGIPLLRLLSDRSGGCGPLLVTFDAHIDSDPNDILLNEVISRCPWKRNIAFGTMLRLRSSQSLQVDSVQGARSRRKIRRSSDNLCDFYTSNGISGSITSSPDDDELYLIGAVDNSHTISFDLQICSRDGKIDDFVSLDSIREFKLKPVVQSCFAYTSVVKNGGEWLTIRRLRVATYELTPTDDVEMLTSSLDLEALSVSLFHKFYAHGLRNGLDSIEDFATEWMLSTLLRCYESAEKLQKRIKRYGDGVSHENFYPEDRLINPNGPKKVKRDALLGLGHEVFRDLPLLIFSLIQCDALRPNDGDFNPSLDSHAAAAANMSNMTPDVIVRCVAPRIEFWLSGVGTSEALDESVNMNISDIRCTIVDQIGTLDGDKDHEILPLLFIDAPYNTFIYDCRDICNLRPATKDDLPGSLLKTRNEAVESYRVPPTTFISVWNDDHHTTAQRAFSCLNDVLVEDSFTSVKNESFEVWCTRLAEILLFQIVHRTT